MTAAEHAEVWKAVAKTLKKQVQSHTQIGIVQSALVEFAEAVAQGYSNEWRLFGGKK